MHLQRRSSPSWEGALDYVPRPGFFLLQVDQSRILLRRDLGAPGSAEPHFPRDLKCVVRNAIDKAAPPQVSSSTYTYSIHYDCSVSYTSNISASKGILLALAAIILAIVCQIWRTLAAAQCRRTLTTSSKPGGIRALANATAASKIGKRLQMNAQENLKTMRRKGAYERSVKMRMPVRAGRVRTALAALYATSVPSFTCTPILAWAIATASLYRRRRR
jgi:hypothetical protein